MSQTRLKTKTATRLFGLILLIGCGLGCITRHAIVIDDNSIYRLGETVKAKIYYWDGTNWVRSSNKITLQEGLYVGKISDEELK